ncbi:hypothetical protein QQS21_010691 [Conoideocrella luteorostrata]|uniref:Uncharacterized protein n=1 Tax=Conoideocrella luteorostrata TaxID=1105319 RepID=A0AAJ0CH86_9HYPO|nr:hypothetical protein QQS21_010691 [Conoideocrella luteorostrata]
MPTYLCHGFRWYRRSIRIFVILNSLDDCAPDWIIGRTTAAIILSQLAESFDFVPRLENEDGTVPGASWGYGMSAAPPPDPKVSRPPAFDDDLSIPSSRVPPYEDNVLMHAWSPIKLLEEYDVDETDHAARPYAYVADYVVRVHLGVDIAAQMANYDTVLKREQSSWFEKLRAQVQPEEQSRWYIVVCDDTEREVPDQEEDSDVDSEVTETETRPSIAQQRAASGSSALSTTSERPLSYENKALPLLPPQQQRAAEQSSSTQRQPSFLDQDPFESGQQPPPQRLRRKLSIRRLFSKKEG